MYFSTWENPATKLYLGSKVDRVAGRVIVNACGNVTIDVPMMRMPTYRTRTRTNTIPYGTEANAAEDFTFMYFIAWENPAAKL